MTSVENEVTGVPVAVVGIALGGIREALVGLIDFLELIGGPGLVVVVRVVLERQPTEGAFYLFTTGVPGDAQDLVVVAFHRSNVATPLLAIMPIRPSKQERHSGG